MLAARTALRQALGPPTAAAAAARALGGAQHLGSSSASANQAGDGQQQQPRDALEWLERFTNWERRGVPAAAGTDTDAGFDLVGGGTALGHRTPCMRVAAAVAVLHDTACQA